MAEWPLSAICTASCQLRRGPRRVKRAHNVLVLLLGLDDGHRHLWRIKGDDVGVDESAGESTRSAPDFKGVGELDAHPGDPFNNACP